MQIREQFGFLTRAGVTRHHNHKVMMHHFESTASLLLFIYCWICQTINNLLRRDKQQLFFTRRKPGHDVTLDCRQIHLKSFETQMSDVEYNTPHVLSQELNYRIIPVSVVLTHAVIHIN